MKIDADIQEQVRKLFAPYAGQDRPGFAVGVVHDKEIVFRQGFGQATLEHPSPIGPQTVFDVGSMAKQFVGMAIALLAEEGRLSIDDRMTEHLDDFPPCAGGITLSHLLHHTSGMRNYTVLAYYMMGYHESDAISSDEVYELLLRVPSPRFTPGERWEYSDSNYFLLAKIVERVTGKTLGEFTKEAIFGPLGMQDTLFRECHSQVIRNRATGYVSHPVAFRSPYLYRAGRECPDAFHTLVSNYEHVGAEGLFSSLDDLLKWVMNLSDNRLGRDPSALIARILTPGVKIDAEIGYGFGINAGTFRGMRFHGHDGAIHGYTSSMISFPEEALSIVCLANHDREGAWEYRDRIIDLLCAAGRAIPASPRPPPPRGAGGHEPEITGMYQNPDTAAIWRVSATDEGVQVRENDRWEFPLVRAAPFEYRSEEPRMSMRFVLDPSGEVAEIRGTAAAGPFTFLPFLPAPLRVGELEEFCGEYRSPELGSSFIVAADGQSLIVRNKARHFCSMDLRYSPTIRDSFIAFDPHPQTSQLTFLRKGGAIASFVFRDCDGDGREDLEFAKVARPPGDRA